MSNNYVGAGILNIITESLYDNPIVVFREYVQNSVDSIFKETDRNNYEIKIWYDENDLCFLDNGKGIDTNLFFDEMIKIGNSTKKKNKNFVKNACFDMMLISETMFFDDIQIFTKDKALKNYCVNLYKSLYEQKSFYKIIENICIKKNIEISNEIRILSEELFNKLNNK